MITHKDIPFSEGGQPALLMDLHVPESPGPHPVILWVHGGGWRQGNRLTPPLLVVERGYALAAIDYRLTPHGTWPAQLDDCKAGVTFVRKNAHKYDLDPGRIVAWGKSAGGHLVAMLALVSGLPANATATWRVQAAADYCGPTDLELFEQTEWRTRFPVLHEVICALIGGPIEKQRAVARDASPLRFVNARCAPMRIVHGDLDEVVPVEEAVNLYRELQKVGAEVELEIAKGVGHNVTSVETDAATLDFFDRQLQGPSSK